MTQTEEQRRTGHAKSVARHRQILAFLRAHEHLIPHWGLLAGMAFGSGLFKSKRNCPAEATLLKTWRTREYWESQDAYHGYPDGYPRFTP